MPARIGEIAVARGVAPLALVEAVLHEPRYRGRPLASRLHAAGVDEGALAAVLAERHGIPGIDLSRSGFSLAPLANVPRHVAEADLLLPLSTDGGRLHLAMARPLDERVISEVRFVTGLDVSVYAALRAPLERAIASAYEAWDRGERAWFGARAPGTIRLALALPGGLEHRGRGEPSPAALVDDPDPEIPLEIDDPEPADPRADGRPVILVVDDEPDIRRLLARTLEAKGYAVIGAADGAEALERADALVPDAVLLDAMLPRVHGFEACRRLRSAPRTRHVPVIMMTAIYRGWRFARDARDHYGASDYVEKPFRLDDLVRRLEAARATAAAAAIDPAAEAAAGAALAEARALLEAGRSAEAAAALTRAIEAHPWSADCHFQLGRARRAGGDDFGAMSALERAAELRPGFVPALRALSAVYQEKGFRRQATEALERALPAATDPAVRTAIEADLLRLG